IALLLTVLVFCRGMTEARTRIAIERLSVKVSELAEHSANTTRSGSAGAGSAEIIGAIDQLNAKIVQLAELLGALAQAEGLITIGADAIARLTEKIEQLAASPAETSDNASHHYAFDEIKAAIDLLTINVRQLTTSIQKTQKPTAEIERWRRGMRQELRDV